MMIAPRRRIIDFALSEWRTTELTAEHDKRVLEQTALFQIFYERSRRLVDFGAPDRKSLPDREMMIPTHAEQRRVFDATLAEASRNKTIAGKRTRYLHVGPVHLEHMVRLVGDVGNLRNRLLHAVRHLILTDTREDLRIVRVLPLQICDVGERVQHFTAIAPVDTGRVVDVQHRVRSCAKLNALVMRRQKARAPDRGILRDTDGNP